MIGLGLGWLMAGGMVFVLLFPEIATSGYFDGMSTLLTSYMVLRVTEG
jgi:hypothetical protein